MLGENPNTRHSWLKGQRRTKRAFKQEVTEEEKGPKRHLLSKFKMFSVVSVVKV